MNLIADLHTHTIASTHAFSSLNEMTAEALKLGLKAMAVTDHAPGVPDSPHVWYFNNLVRLPDIIQNDFLLLKGAEANVMSPQGNIDLEPAILEKLDWVIASVHSSCIASLRYEQATAMWLAVAQNPLVDMIGHSEQRQYLYDYDLVTKAFAAGNKVVELNANSAVVRPGNEENMRQLALCCKKNNTKVAVNSDAHSTYGLGNGAGVLAMLKEIDFPEELVINSSMERLLGELALHNKPIVQRIKGKLKTGSFKFA
ncbi:MAG: phosphatase [Oscillospiraceae bacterium]